ncbi:hypothetical protein GTS_14500 [Gandjariella thermophila]|uniref:Uncharacterized protein n=1 Tax=Gandjariella thermophila TaxID=1931992 RepID=A0A4D4J788_9PSEU|nr:hypothetical protein GTS_14500 [Gandjariella thermophila]
MARCLIRRARSSVDAVTRGPVAARAMARGFLADCGRTPPLDVAHSVNPGQYLG